MKGPDLSIIIITYNNSKLLKDCIQSVASSRGGLALETIVTDNGSHDDTEQMVKMQFPEVRLIRNEGNLGFARANNRGIAESRGRYVMLLNDDTRIHAGALERMVEFMDSNPSAGACGPKLLNTDGTPQRQSGLLSLPFWRSDKPKEAGFVMGACLMVRREAIDKVGTLDENLFFYNEDMDWCRRIRSAGYKVYFLPGAEVTHFGGYSTRRSFNRRMFVEGFRGGLYFCRKHYGPLAFQAYRLILVLLFPLGIIGLTITAPFRRFREYAEKLKAYFDIFRITIFGPIEYPWNVNGQIPKPDDQ